MTFDEWWDDEKQEGVRAETNKSCARFIWIDAQAHAARPEEVAYGASPRLLLDQVRREWYRHTGYSQLKADIDHYLDSSPPQKSEGT